MTVSYSTKGLDHLGLVSGMCKDIGIAQFIDAAIQIKVKISTFHMVNSWKL